MKYVCMVFAIIAFCSCELMVGFYEVPEYPYLYDEWMEENIPEMRERGLDDTRIFEGICNRVLNTIEYMPDEEKHGQTDYWQTPVQTYRFGTGDCEDLAILMGFFAKKYLGVNATLYGARKDSNVFRGHMWIEWNGVVVNKLEGYSIVSESHTIDEALILAEYLK